MVTTNGVGNLAAATWSSGFVEHAAFGEPDGRGTVCVMGPMADLLARIGPDHIVDRTGLVVRFRRSPGFQRIILAVADALERAIAEQRLDLDMDAVQGNRLLRQGREPRAVDGC